MKFSTAAGGWNQSRRLWALTVAMSACLLLLLLELEVRVLVGGPLPERLPLLTIRANPHRGWEMVPGMHYTYTFPVHVNSLGLRGPEIVPKQPGEVRVLALGDSLVYGQGVPDDRTLPRLLEDALREQNARRDRRFTVVNGGLRAYATNQELGLLRELGETIDPDVVVLFWYWNDIEEPSIDLLYRQLQNLGPVPEDTRAPLEGATLLRWKQLQWLRKSALLMYLHDVAVAWGAAPVPEPEIRAAMSRLDGHLGAFQEMAREHRFRFLMAVIPDPAALAREHHSREIARRAMEIASTRGVRVVPLATELRKVSSAILGAPVVPHDGHYNPEANAAMAEVVARAILEAEGASGASTQ